MSATYSVVHAPRVENDPGALALGTIMALT